MPLTVRGCVSLCVGWSILWVRVCLCSDSVSRRKSFCGFLALWVKNQEVMWPANELWGYWRARPSLLSSLLTLWYGWPSPLWATSCPPWDLHTLELLRFCSWSSRVPRFQEMSAVAKGPSWCSGSVLILFNYQLLIVYLLYTWTVLSFIRCKKLLGCIFEAKEVIW